MPIYSLRCSNPDCLKYFELICNKDDLADAECVHCGTLACEQLPTAPGSYKIKGDNSASVTPKKFRS